MAGLPSGCRSAIGNAVCFPIVWDRVLTKRNNDDRYTINIRPADAHCCSRRCYILLHKKRLTWGAGWASLRLSINNIRKKAMSYRDFQTVCARMGFTSTPLTQSEFDKVIVAGFDDGDAYAMGCDMAADAYDSIEDAISDYAIKPCNEKG